MAVVAHHPVIVHFKGIAGGLFAIDINIAAFYIDLVVFIYFDGPAVSLLRVARPVELPEYRGQAHRGNAPSGPLPGGALDEGSPGQTG